MSGFWEINSEILRRQYSGLTAELCREDETPAPDIAIETAASGALCLRVNGLYVHSPRSPEREGRRQAEAANVQDSAAGNSPVIILGFGLGYAAEAAAALAPQRPLIIVEKYRRLLKAAFESRDLRALLSRQNVIFVPGASVEAVTKALFLLENSGAEKAAPVVIRNRALAGLDSEWYEAVEGRIRTFTMRDDVNRATLKRFGKRWVRNLARNMSAIRDLPGISGLAGLAAGSGEMAHTGIETDSGTAADRAGIPVFLAAAGPGLDRIAPLLPEIRKRCIIAAVDTSLRFLLKHGVEPDFALIVDPQFWNSRHLDRAAGKRVRLIAESAVYPPALRLPFRAVYLCGSLFPLGSFIEKRVDPKGLLGAGGSVATTAWDFARSIGARDIWIAGLDLAFPGLKTHFRGALFEEKALAESGRKNPAETWLVRALRDGLPFYAPSAPPGRVLTDRRLSLYAAWFENRFRRYPEIRSRSLSSGGLAIAGLETAKAEDLRALPERREEIERRLEAAFSRIETDFFEPEATRRRDLRYREALAALLQGIEQIKDAACKGAGIAETALKRSLSPAEERETLAQLDGIMRRVAESEVKEAAGFLFPPEEAAEREHEGRENPFRSFLQSSARLYRSLADAAAFNLRELETYRSKAYIS